MYKYYFRCPGMGHAWDFYADNMKHALEKVRGILGVKRLPVHTEIWKA